MLVLEALEKAEVEVADELLGKAFSRCVGTFVRGVVTPLCTLWFVRELLASLSDVVNVWGKALLKSCPAGRMEEGPGPLVPASTPGVSPPCPPRPCSPEGQLPGRAPRPGSPTQAEP